jgi:hypothetical protein
MKSPEVHTAVLPEENLAFLFQRDRFHTLRLIVRPDGSVLVKAPLKMPFSAVLSFIRSHLNWIQTRQTFFFHHQKAVNNFQAGSSVWYLGKAFELLPIETGRGKKARLHRNRLEIPCKTTAQDGVSPAALKRGVQIWQKALAERILPKRLQYWEERVCAILGDNVRYSQLTVRTMKSRWGSCSVKGSITLASRLISLPLPLIDYVLCHELCHLRRMDHSAAFHACLNQILPDAKSRRQHIRVWSLEHPS